MAPVESSTERPLVSVIVPAYNAALYIGETIESLLSQSWWNLELIVVDDGSIDETASVVESFCADSRLKLIRQTNSGPGSARNTGLAAARGSFLQFLDADDLLSPMKIERQVQALCSSDRDSVAVCAWGRFYQSLADVVIKEEPVWRVEDPVEWFVASLEGQGMMHSGGWMMPRDVVERAGPWDAQLTLHDDGEYFSRVLMASRRIVFVEGAFAFYRTSAVSLSRTVSRAAAASALRVCQCKEQLLEGKKSEVRIRTALATEYARFVYQFSDKFADLASVGDSALISLNAEPLPCIGGRLLRFLSRILGFRRAMWIRGLLR